MFLLGAFFLIILGISERRRRNLILGVGFLAFSFFYIIGLYLMVDFEMIFKILILFLVLFRIIDLNFSLSKEKLDSSLPKESLDTSSSKENLDTSLSKENLSSSFPTENLEPYFTKTIDFSKTIDLEPSLQKRKVDSFPKSEDPSLVKNITNKVKKEKSKDKKTKGELEPPSSKDDSKENLKPSLPEMATLYVDLDEMLNGIKELEKKIDPALLSVLKEPSKKRKEVRDKWDKWKEEGVREWLLMQIKNRLRFKFGDEASRLFPRLERIKDPIKLEFIKDLIELKNSLSEIEKFID